MYSKGGWKIIPGSCSSGFRSRPSMGAGKARSNGLDVNSVKAMNPTLTRPSTASTRATVSSGRLRLKRATARLQPDSMNCQSNSDPSWPPQVPATRKGQGSSELACWLT